MIFILGYFFTITVNGFWFGEGSDFGVQN